MTVDLNTINVNTTTINMTVDVTINTTPPPNTSSTID